MIDDKSKNQPTFKIVLAEEGSGVDILRAILHATKWDQIRSGSVFLDDFQEAHTWMTNIFAPFYAELLEMDWKKDALIWTDNGVRFNWK